MSVTHRIEAGVAEVYIDQPPVNAPDSAGWNRLAETCSAFACGAGLNQNTPAHTGTCAPR